jgi:predicted LPLAT superfamily acyltransferase
MCASATAASSRSTGSHEGPTSGWGPSLVPSSVCAAPVELLVDSLAEAPVVLVVPVEPVVPSAELDALEPGGTSEKQAQRTHDIPRTPARALVVERFSRMRGCTSRRIPGAVLHRSLPDGAAVVASRFEMSVPTPESSATPPATRDERTTWLGTAERGTLLGIRIVFFLATVFGRAPARLLVRVIALWYALFDRPARDASQQWFTVVDGRPPSWKRRYAHVLRFAQITLDRIFFLQGKYGVFEITRTGPHHLQDAKRAGRGAILLGAHLGSFEAMRAGAEDDALAVNILGHFENARMINALFERLNPGIAARVIHIGTDSIDFIFKVQQCIDRGEFVAVLGDRTGLHEKTVVADFFGRPARFPTGPFTLAALLKCPVLLTFGLYREPNRYDLHCEPFADQVVLPRKRRDAELRDLVTRFARRLEHYCREAPDNWFNFYDFWELPERDEPAQARTPSLQGEAAPPPHTPGSG